MWFFMHKICMRFHFPSLLYPMLVESNQLFWYVFDMLSLTSGVHSFKACFAETTSGVDASCWQQICLALCVYSYFV